jgi:hypothetical protein
METSAKEMIIELDSIGNIEDLFEREKLIVKMQDYIKGWIERYRGLFGSTKMPKDSIVKIHNLIEKCEEIKRKFLAQKEVLSPEDKASLDARWEEEGELKQSESSPAPAPAPTTASNVLLNPYTMHKYPPAMSPNVLLNPYTPSLGGSGYRRRNKRSKKQSKKSKKSRRSKKSKKSRKTKTSRRR